MASVVTVSTLTNQIMYIVLELRLNGQMRAGVQYNQFKCCVTGIASHTIASNVSSQRHYIIRISRFFHR